MTTTRGPRRVTRAKRTQQPTPPAPPGWLSDDARRAGSEARGRLPGELTAQLEQQLEAYAVERSRWLASEVHLREHGLVYLLRTDKGELTKVVEAPEVKIAARAQDRMLKLGGQLGLGRSRA